MNIKRIILNNIRSYKEQEIIFPEGSTLLSGDIGSGKTSVLLGIEFALFGLQPGQRGSSLLRNGEDRGGVVLEFEVENNNIIIERTLKRGKTISQGYCAITINGDKREISVTELKNLVLEILNYPAEFVKRQNLLYKFTVYTPQEEMKQIILQDSETRMNTLRHVFGIDKYKRIIENTSILTSKIREERRLMEGITLNLEQDKMELLSKEEELETKHHNLISIEKELFSKTQDRKKMQEEKDEVSKKIKEKTTLQQQIEKLKIIVSNKKETISSNNERIKELKNQVAQLEKFFFDESEIKKIEAEIGVRKKERIEFEEKNLQIASKIHSLENQNTKNEEIKNKIMHVEICPTCLQDVAPNYKSNVLNKLDSDTSRNVRQIQELTLEKQAVSKKISDIDSEISAREKRIHELNLLKIKIEGIKEKQSNIKKLEALNTSLEKDMELLLEHNKILEQSISQLKKYDSIFEVKSKLLEEALQKERMAEIKVAELKKEIDFFSKQTEELREKIRKTREVKKRLDYLGELENWLSQKFISLISFIEKNVMIKLKAEFSKLFSEWFSMLVSDAFNIRLTDNFTPLVEYHDYEIDYSYLSGGERTAVALAYRLALDQVINSLLSKIKTKDLVILDEPTDGFSEQQLDKMRDVLQQLDIKQIIIVSHEQKIEGFVENVIRFKKERGVSQKDSTSES